MIEVKNLSKYFGTKKAVDGITFTVNNNEVLGFLGPNGAGKSTTMNILTGYISMTAGEVRIDGIDILENPIEAKKKIGYLPEQPPVYPEMSVKEYLSFVAELKGIKPVKDEVKRVAQLVGISNVMDRRIGNLSKGYKQRTGFAAALTGDPSVLILDEPTVGLDPKQIVEIRELIRSLGEKHTVILSSHILPEIKVVCNRILVINNGKLAAEDTPENLMKSGSDKVKRIIIKPDGAEEEICRVLDGLDGLSYEKLDDEYEINISGDTDNAGKKLFFAFANAGIAITEQREEEVSLEDIFMELTKEEK